MNPKNESFVHISKEFFFLYINRLKYRQISSKFLIYPGKEPVVV